MTETLQRLLVCFSDFAFVFFWVAGPAGAGAKKKAVISPRLRAAFLKAKLPLGSVHFILARRLRKLWHGFSADGHFLAYSISSARNDKSNRQTRLGRDIRLGMRIRCAEVGRLCGGRRRFARQSLAEHVAPTRPIISFISRGKFFFRRSNRLSAKKGAPKRGGGRKLERKGNGGFDPISQKRKQTPPCMLFYPHQSFSANLAGR